METNLNNSRFQLPACGQGARAAVAAMAVAATSLSAHAQSSVTIYGIIDQGLTKATDGTTPAAFLPGRAGNDAWQVKAGNTSRLGFRGHEDLGGGQYARFQMEHRFAADTGASSNANVFWLGRTVVAELFAAYCAHPAEMPAEYAGAADLHRTVADYIAGLTDRFALREHHRLSGRRLFDA